MQSNGLLFEPFFQVNLTNSCILSVIVSTYVHTFIYPTGLNSIGLCDRVKGNQPNFFLVAISVTYMNAISNCLMIAARQMALIPIARVNNVTKQHEYIMKQLIQTFMGIFMKRSCQLCLPFPDCSSLISESA